MKKSAVHTGPPATGAPYSPGIIAGDLVFVSGQVPLDPKTKQLAEGGFEEHVVQCIKNVESILLAAGTDLAHVVKVTIFLKDLNNFGRLNAAYGSFWGDVRPARSCVEVARLPMDVDVEIEAIAVLPS